MGFEQDDGGLASDKVWNAYVWCKETNVEAIYKQSFCRDERKSGGIKIENRGHSCWKPRLFYPARLFVRWPRA